MKYIFDTPEKIGNITNRITVEAMELASVSFNFEPYYMKNGEALVSIVLVHRASDYKENIVYSGAEGLAFWELMKSADHSKECMETKIIKILAQDKKIPPGRIESNIAQDITKVT
jgi:hypothetical protein